MAKNDRRLTAPCCLLLAVCLGGCGVYSTTSGRVDDSVRRISVPYLVNETAEPSIGTELTELIIKAIQDDNTLKVIDENGATAELSGSVLGYRLREVFATSQMQVDEYQVQITVELSLRVRATGEAIFEKKRINGSGNFLLDDPNGSTETTARAEAAAQIVRDVLAVIVEDW
jgi:hypothetical protein